MSLYLLHYIVIRILLPGGIFSMSEVGCELIQTSDVSILEQITSELGELTFANFWLSLLHESWESIYSVDLLN